MLPVSRLVRVTINLSPLAAATRSFGVLMIAGDSNVINGVERFRTYAGIDEVASDFGTTAPEYKAALLYFGQSPKPATLMIGRWFRTASSAQNLGEILSSAQQMLSSFTAVTSGGFTISIDGTPQNLTGLNFSSAVNLNGVAAIVNAALSGATCIWNGREFVITSTSTGLGSFAVGTIALSANPSYGVRANNTIDLTGNPSNGDTVDIQGTTVTFVTGSPGPLQVQIAGSAAATALNLQNFLAASADTNLALMTYNTIGVITTITARLYGTAGNAYTLAKSGTNITIGGATFSGGVNPETLTVNGVAFTFVPTGFSPLTATLIQVGATPATTATNINTVLNASVNGSVDVASYSVSDVTVTVTYKTAGTAGNSFTLATTSSNITVPATLSGGATSSSVGYATAPGSGTDISTLLGLTSATSLLIVPGYDPETPVACTAILADLSTAWYGLMFAASVQPTDDQSVDVAAFIEADSVSRVFGATIINSNVLSSVITTDLASRLMALGYKQSTTQYSENPYAIASLFGRAFSVNFLANNTTITLMYKQEPGVAPQDLSTTDANVLKAKRCNVFAEYVNDTFIVQYGTMAGPAWFDEIHGLDWFQDAVQTACYNLLYTSPTKIPQTDPGVNQFVNAISGACDQAVSNGLAAPGVWNGPGFGQLQTGQYLKTGYYIFAQPIALQSQSDRDARISPPITVALKLAGAIQELDVLVNVNR